MSFTVVHADASMLPQIEAIEQACFSMPWPRAQLAAQLDADRHVFLAALDGKRVLGYVGMMYVLDEGYIANVAVAPDARRQGVGRALIESLLACADRMGLAFVTLEVRPSNDAAIALYSAFGFEPVGRRRNYYEKPSEDALLMTKYRKECLSPC